MHSRKQNRPSLRPISDLLLSSICSALCTGSVQVVPMTYVIGSTDQTFKDSYEITSDLFISMK